jgi:hypothetical protein
MYKGRSQQDTITIPAVSPNQLFDKRRDRDAAKLKSYNRILEQIYKRVITASKSQEQTWIAYAIPPLMLSFNTDELEDCMTYVVHMLRQQGYEVRYTYPNLLHISWTKYERDYLMKENPIVQAMTPPPESTKNKRHQAPAGPIIQRPANMPSAAPRVQFSLPSYGNSYGLPSSAVGAQPVIAPPKPVTAYKPPTSFINAVERPLPNSNQKSAIDAFLGF